MPQLVMPRDQFKALLRRRRETGADRYDEVWNGVYVMSPIANNQHQELATLLAAVILQAFGPVEGLSVFAGVNVSDRAEDWRKNFRCPDVAVYLPGNPAEDRKTHWLGGPDFCVEVVSRGDRARKKFEFYAAVGVREFLLVERDPWRLELYRRNDEGGWTPAGYSTPEQSQTISSAVLPLTFRLVEGQPRPKVEITHADGQRSWTA